MIGESVTPVGVRHRLSEREWQRLEHDPEFQTLLAAKLRFIVPATVFFIVYYFAFLILVGYFPTLMEKKVVGQINLAYVAAISEFVMVWVVTYLYVQRAKAYDVQAQRVIDTLKAEAHR